MPEKPPINFIDNPHAPEIFATDATGFWLNDGCLHITFEAARVDHSTNPGPLNRVVVGRLVMSMAGAQSLAFGLYDFLKRQGSPRRRPMTVRFTDAEWRNSPPEDPVGRRLSEERLGGARRWVEFAIEKTSGGRLGASPPGGKDGASGAQPVLSRGPRMLEAHLQPWQIAPSATVRSPDAGKACSEAGTCKGARPFHHLHARTQPHRIGVCEHDSTRAGQPTDQSTDGRLSEPTSSPGQVAIGMSRRPSNASSAAQVTRIGFVRWIWSRAIPTLRISGEQ